DRPLDRPRWWTGRAGLAAMTGVDRIAGIHSSAFEVTDAAPDQPLLDAPALDPRRRRRCARPEVAPQLPRLTSTGGGVVDLDGRRQIAAIHLIEVALHRSRPCLQRFRMIDAKEVGIFAEEAGPETPLVGAHGRRAGWARRRGDTEQLDEPKGVYAELEYRQIA